MLCNKKAITSAFFLALNFSGATAGIWSGNDEKKARDEIVISSIADQSQYGVDVSFPIHYAHVSTNYEWLPHNQELGVSTPKEFEDMVPQPLGDREDFYRNFMQGCRDKFGSKGVRCTQTELDRISMNLRQPQSMQNYTDVGFKSKCH